MKCLILATMAALAKAGHDAPPPDATGPANSTMEGDDGWVL